MTPGNFARRLLGPRYFAVVGGAYRRIFVDLDKVAAAIGPFRPGVRVLDIGGGDGVLLNLLLTVSPEATVTMVEQSAGVGAQLKSEYRKRVTCRPNTTLAEYARESHEPPDVVLISDVIHHVPGNARRAFLTDVHDVLGGQPCELFLKDMEPGHFRTWLGGLADRYISGDRQVRFLAKSAVIHLVHQVFDQVAYEETNLFKTDCPNYCLRFALNGKLSSTKSHNEKEAN